MSRSLVRGRVLYKIIPNRKRQTMKPKQQRQAFEELQRMGVSGWLIPFLHKMAYYKRLVVPIAGIQSISMDSDVKNLKISGLKQLVEQLRNIQEGEPERVNVKQEKLASTALTLDFGTANTVTLVRVRISDTYQNQLKQAYQVTLNDGATQLYQFTIWPDPSTKTQSQDFLAVVARPSNGEGSIIKSNALDIVIADGQVRDGVIADAQSLTTKDF